MSSYYLTDVSGMASTSERGRGAATGPLGARLAPLHYRARGLSRATDPKLSSRHLFWERGSDGSGGKRVNLMKFSLRRCGNFISLMLEELKTVHRSKAELNTEVAPARTRSTSQPPRGPCRRNRIIWPQKHTPSAPEWKRAEALSRTKYAFQTFRGSLRIQPDVPAAC